MPARRPPPPAGPLHAYVYTRVSRVEQSEGVSLDAQLMECRRYAVAFGWALGPEFCDILTGTRDDRPQYQALLAAVRQARATGQAVAVVVLRLDRLGRRLAEQLRCREELKALGVPLHSVRQGGEVSDLIANILASVAQEEVRQLGERVAGAKRHIMALGWHPVSRTTWGYTLRDATAAERAAGAPKRVLALDAVTAPYALELFERFARGQSTYDLTAWVKALPESARGGRAWSRQQVARTLANPTYRALIFPAPEAKLPGREAKLPGREAKLPAPARWPALVPPDLAAQVDARLARLHRGYPRERARYLLSGIARCPGCGGGLGGHPPHGRRPALYGCHARLTPDCGRSWVIARLDAVVLAEIMDTVNVLFRDIPAAQRELRRAWQRQSQTFANKPGANVVRALERERAQAERRLTEAARLLVDGVLDRAGYERLRDEAQGALEAVRTRLAALQPPAAPLPPLEIALRHLGGLGAVLAGADVPAQRQALLALLRAVVPHWAGRGRYTVAVEWTALGSWLREATGR